MRLPRLLVVALVACAASAVTSARRLEPQGAATYLSSAETHYRNGDIDGALADYDQAIKLDPRNPAPYMLRGFLRLQTRDVDGAIADFSQGIVLDPKNGGNFALRGSAKYQKKDLDGAIGDSRQARVLDPRMLMPCQTLARAYWDKAYTTPGVSTAEKRELVALGTEAVDAALEIQSDDLDMSVYRGLFLRLQASLEPDEAQQRRLVQKADAWAKVVESLRALKGMPAPAPAAAPPPRPVPPPPPPPAPVLRVGTGTLPSPKKLVHVEPIYPQIAVAARVSGVVELDILIDERGKVTEVTVTKSIPILDQSAVTAVKQWTYEPTTIGGRAVPVRLAVTVAFKLTEG